MNKICFDKSTFLIGIIILIVGIIVLDKFIHNYYSQKKVNNIIVTKENNKSNNDENKKYIDTQPNVIATTEIPPPPPSKREILYTRDQRALNDPLAPPTRRNPGYTYPPHLPYPPLDIPSRGYPDTYQYYGNLRRADGKVVKLFGRQVYPGSHEYEYYGITSDNYGSEVKIKIETQRREIYDGDEIDINFLDVSKGKFKLYLNDYDRPRYNPFLI